MGNEDGDDGKRDQISLEADRIHECCWQTCEARELLMTMNRLRAARYGAVATQMGRTMKLPSWWPSADRVLVVYREENAIDC